MKHFIIDFDSTFTKVEAFDLLGEIVLKGEKNKHKLAQIEEVTCKAMEGSMSLHQSLQLRISILNAHRNHLPLLIKKLHKQVSTSFIRNKIFIDKYKDQLYIISNGFKDFILPVVTKYGVKKENIFANEFIYDNTGYIIGFDSSNVLSDNNGKSKLTKKLNLKGEVFVIGDGYNDLEIKKEGLVNKFYAFTENISRTSVMQQADHVAATLDDFLFSENLERAYSYPKNRIKVLLLENIHSKALDKLKKEGHQITTHEGAMDEATLCEAIQEVSILGIRSKTNISSKVLAKAKRLMAIGAFCIGTNHIDLEGCLKKGVAVFNAPYSNTRSVVELTIANIIFLKRNLIDKVKNMHQGKWLKSASQSFEIRGKTLGIIGYGKIGSQLSILAESMGMKVQYFDIKDQQALGNAICCTSLRQVLSTSDIISIHIDGRPENNEFISYKEFKLMKKGVIFINYSRGNIVNIDALSEYIDNGKVAGTAIDVFPTEPVNNQQPFHSKLIGKQNTILTPHIGGSTQEAQENIADYVPNKMIEYINSGSTTNSVNFPVVTLPSFHNAHRFIHIHRNEPGLLAEINKILAKHNINIIRQYLSTNHIIGYVITDIDKKYSEKVIKELKSTSGTIKFRVLY